MRLGIQDANGRWVDWGHWLWIPPGIGVNFAERGLSEEREKAKKIEESHLSGSSIQWKLEHTVVAEYRVSISVGFLNFQCLQRTARQYFKEMAELLSWWNASIYGKVNAWIDLQAPPNVSADCKRNSDMYSQAPKRSYLNLELNLTPMSSFLLWQPHSYTPKSNFQAQWLVLLYWVTVKTSKQRF